MVLDMLMVFVLSLLNISFTRIYKMYNCILKMHYIWCDNYNGKLSVIRAFLYFLAFFACFFIFHYFRTGPIRFPRPLPMFIPHYNRSV